MPGDDAVAISGVRIRLTDERWDHIVTGHRELAGLRQGTLRAIADPDELRRGRNGALLAIKAAGARHWLVVVYREQADDGFVVTALITSRYAWIARRAKLWPT
jgi:hypothetical protein